jgi:hypothetical protein
MDLGSSKTQYFHAIWQRRALLSRQRACQARDAHFDPPSSNQVQVQ